MAEQTEAIQKKVKEPKLAPTRDTKREYETIYLLRQDLATEQVDRIKERVRGIVDREGGRVIKFTTWGRKKTAFLVGDKETRAIFVHMAYLGEGGMVQELERNFRNMEEVLKYQTLKISDAVLPESRPTEEDVVLEGDRDEERPMRETRGDRDEGGDSRPAAESAEPKAEAKPDAKAEEPKAEAAPAEEAKKEEAEDGASSKD